MITLKNSHTEVTFSAERGAIVTSCKVGGKELLYLDQATFDDPSKNVRGGIPVLFPICGPLANPAYEVAGNSYAMKQHGFARTLPWTVLESLEHRAVLELADTPETLRQYPFAFSYRLTFEATKDGLRIGQEIHNKSAEPMPFQVGFHPYFVVGSKEALSFDLPVTRFADNKSEAEGLFQGFDFQRDEIDWAFPNPTALEAGFIDPQRGLRVKVGYEADYQSLVFWTLKGLPYICLEPWSSARLAFPGGSDVHRLAPGDVWKSQVTITALPIG